MSTTIPPIAPNDIYRLLIEDEAGEAISDWSRRSFEHLSVEKQQELEDAAKAAHSLAAAQASARVVTGSKNRLRFMALAIALFGAAERCCDFQCPHTHDAVTYCFLSLGIASCTDCLDGQQEDWVDEARAFIAGGANEECDICGKSEELYATTVQMASWVFLLVMCGRCHAFAQKVSAEGEG
jgi:hypothetical protein